MSHERAEGRGGWLSWIRLLGLALLWAPAATAQTPLISEAPEPKRVLFVGNSFTYYNQSLHSHLRALVDERMPEGKQQRTFRAMTISGARLDEHVLGARGMIEKGVEGPPPRPWDVVVLQGHSRETLEEASARRFAESAAALDGWVREAGARSVLFMTWAYTDRPEMTPVIDEAYTRVGNRLAARVAPVGLAFARLRAERPEYALRTGDAIHPTVLGSYLAANVFYATLYGRSPEGSAYLAGLDPAVAAEAQKIAWETVQAYQTR